MSSKAIPEKYRIWIDAQKKFHLSNKHIQMARELGLNPKKFGSLVSHKQELWKRSLSEFIEELYLKRFHKDKPDCIESIEDMVKRQKQKKAEAKERKECKRAAEKKEIDVHDSII